MWNLEGDLKDLMSTEFLHPKEVVLTIRHTDWWDWEDDEDLAFNGQWVEAVSEVLPASVGKFQIELESVMRKREQVDAIATQMAKHWFFKRKDDIPLFPDSSCNSNETSQWRGSSTWHRQRWPRDETEKGWIDYHLVTVTFQRQLDVEKQGGIVSEEVAKLAEDDEFPESWFNLFTVRERHSDGEDDEEYDEEHRDEDIIFEESSEDEPTDEGSIDDGLPRRAIYR